MFELGTFAAPRRARVALHREHRVRLDHAVIATVGPVLPIVDLGVLVGQADTVGKAGVAAGDEVVAGPKGARGQLPEAEAGPDQLDVVMNLFIGMAIDLALLFGRRRRPAQRQVREISAQ